MNASQIKAKITRAFNRYMAAPGRKIFDAIPKSLTDGKLYEAYVMGLVAKGLL